MILGIGALVAFSVCPKVFEMFTKDGVTNFRALFLVPCGAAVFAAISLALFFHPPKIAQAKTQRTGATVAS